MELQQPSPNYIKAGVIYIVDPTVCFLCKRTDLSLDEKYCPTCGFPQNGEQDEQKTFYRDYLLENAAMSEAKKNVKGAQTILFVASGLSIISGFVLSLTEMEQWGLIAGFAMCVIFLGLGFWAQQKPLAASVTGLVLYGTLVLVSIAMTFKGVSDGDKFDMPFGILDIVIIIFLAKGIVGSLKAEKIRKERGWDWNTNK